MLNKKFLSFILFIFIMSIASVNAYDIDNGTIAYENQLSSDIGDDVVQDNFLQESNNELLSNDSNTVEIKCIQVNNNLIVSAVDNEGNNLTEGHFLFVSQNADELNDYLNGESFILFDLYSFPYTSYPQNIIINFDNPNYLPANLTFLAYLNNSIVAHDVVDESLFSISVFDENSNPLDRVLVGIELYDGEGTFFKDFSTFSDIQGLVILDLALQPDNYTVLIKNLITSQVSQFWWNITNESQNKKTWINATVQGYDIFIDVLTYNNDTDIELKTFDVYVDGEFVTKVHNQIFEFYDLDVGNHTIDLYYNGNGYYYDSNLSLTVYVRDTIKVNDSFYNTSVVDAYFVDYDGNPLINATIFFYIDDDLYVNKTDEDGHASFDFAVMPGIYDVKIKNTISNQGKTVLMDVIEEDMNKKAFINITQDNYIFTAHVSNINGTPIDGGTVIIYQNDMGSTQYLVNGTVKYMYDFPSSVGSPDTLLFILKNDNYYSTNATITFDVINTIISEDVNPKKLPNASVFNATFLDMDEKPLVETEVAFVLFDLNNNLKFVENRTVLTDENGFASIEITDKHFIYYVQTINPVTYQRNLNYWFNQIQVNITPRADYIDESNGDLYLNNTTITFDFSPENNCIVAIFIDDFIYYEGHVEDGQITFDFPSYGKFDFSLGFYGNIDYYAEEIFYTAIINKMYVPNMTISENLVSNYLDDVNFTVNLVNGSNFISNASVNIIIGNDSYDLLTDENGNICISVGNLEAGVYDIAVEYKGNGTYFAVNKTTTLTVNKIIANITVNESTIGYGETLYVNIDANATGNITVEINDEKYESNINNSVAAIDLSELPKGNYEAKITYSGDNNYYNSTISSNITVKPVEIDDFNVTADPIIVGGLANIEIQLPSDASGNITAVVDGENYTSLVENGKANIYIHFMDEGNYTVPLFYSGDDKYDSLTANATVVVIKPDTSDIIIAPDLIKYYGGSERFTVNVTDYRGNPLSNKSVKIHINGMDYERITDENGSASMAIRLDSGLYNATVTVDNKSIISLITILPTVNATDLVKIFRNGTQYYATFRDSEGNYLKDGTTVRFNIHGVMYDRTVSGDKGLAKLNINLEQGEYIITAINLVTGESRANKITVIPILVENKDITKYYRNETQYTVKVLGGDGKPVGAGVEVTFNINGVFYTRTTNESGIAKLNINLQPGDYIVTAEYNGCMVSNNIKVLPVLTANDLIKKYGTNDQFIANLVDGQGNPYSNQKIEFNINGIFYYRTTDSNGHAKLNINLMEGVYIITSSYNSSYISNYVVVIS